MLLDFGVELLGIGLSQTGLSRIALDELHEENYLLLTSGNVRNRRFLNQGAFYFVRPSSGNRI